MKWLNPSVYLIGALLTLGPVGLRLATRSEPPQQTLDQHSIAEGKMLFLHEFKPNDPLCPNGDGLGPVYNATSCVACHNKGGVGGAGENRHNVTNFVRREGNAQGVVHTMAIGQEFQELLSHASPTLQPKVATFENVSPLSKNVDRSGTGISISQRNTPALFGARLIDAIPDHVIISGEHWEKVGNGWASPKSEDRPAGRALRLPNGKIGKFGWKAQSASLADFVVAACANELGLGNPGQPQPRSMAKPNYQAPGLDLTEEQCRQITTFIAALDRPREVIPAEVERRDFAHDGKQLFMKIGCAECHTPTVGSVEGIYSDLLLHRMGSELEGQGSYNGPVPQPDSPSDGSPLPDEWRTPPLWGIADSGPYLHDGRAKSLQEAIQMHGGQGRQAANAFQALPPAHQQQLIDFLNTLQAPRPQQQ